jgi:chemotaxis protein CheD
MQSILELGGQQRQIVAKFAGGADMFATASATAVGELNIAMVESLLKDARLPVIGRHCGGTRGRRMDYNVETGAVAIEIVGGVMEVI